MPGIIRIAVLTGLFLIAAPAQAQQQVGRVLLAAGDAVAVRGNQTVRLALGSPIQDRDLLRTGPASNLQVRFNDESITSLRENSELNIEQFHFTGKEDGSERAVFRLLKGGLRTITGLVGRTNKANYTLSSMTSTIGIRGSDFSVRACQGDCVKADGSRERDGLFGSVHGISPTSGSNAINVANKVTNLTVGINQHFYDNGTVIERLLAQPEVVTSGPRGKTAVAKGPASGKEQAASGGASQDSRSGAGPAATTPLSFVAPGPGESNVGPPVATETASLSSSATFTPTIAGVGALFDTFGGPGDGNGGGFFAESHLTRSPAGAAPGTPQHLLSFTLPAGFSAEVGGGQFGATGVSGGIATVIDETNPANSLKANWGRWTSGSLTEQDGTPNPIAVNANNQFHYMYAPLTPAEVVAAKTGSFSLFDTGFGSTPTNNLGQLGTFGASPGTINFTTRQVSFGPSGFCFGSGCSSQNWSFSGFVTPLNIAPGKGAFVNAVTNGSCSGANCSGSATLGVTGIIAGPKGDHLIAGQHARTVSGPQASAQNTRIYTCAPSC